MSPSCIFRDIKESSEASKCERCLPEESRWFFATKTVFSPSVLFEFFHLTFLSFVHWFFFFFFFFSFSCKLLKPCLSKCRGAAVYLLFFSWLFFFVSVRKLHETRITKICLITLICVIKDWGWEGRKNFFDEKEIPSLGLCLSEQWDHHHTMTVYEAGGVTTSSSGQWMSDRWWWTWRNHAKCLCRNQSDRDNDFSRVTTFFSILHISALIQNVMLSLPKICQTLPQMLLPVKTLHYLVDLVKDCILLL